MSVAAAGARAPAPTAEELAEWVAAVAADRKAIDVVDIDLSGLAGFTDRFVICTGNTERQTKAIHDAILEHTKRERAITPRRVEGLPQAQWILMDYLDVIVHIFTPQARDFYRLESLWGEAPSRRFA
ncbi:MAG: ribosome silencing factor [Solirubrobacteraceae bacterium]